MCAYQLKVTLSDSYFKKLGLKGQDYNNIIRDTLITSAVKAEELTRREAPIKTGNLRRSINHYTKGSMESGVLARGAPYWLIIEYGSAPHIITPKKEGGLLHFRIGGEYVFAKKVNHPGTPPNPFVKRSLNLVKSRGIIQNAFSNSLKKYGIE